MAVLRHWPDFARQDRFMTEDISALFLTDEKKAWFRHDRFGMFVH